MITLFKSGTTSSNLNWLVKITVMYLPAIGLIALLFLLGSLSDQRSNKLSIDDKAPRIKAIKLILKKWNEKKFHPLGFSWSYCEETDTLELSIDADLEIFEEKSESVRKSLKNT